ncbi:AraC family transcriptional regulator [Lacibacter cauensis]|uniref:AraC family transcriptional regulator n=1 Tax=Lacibacter cauensis TaxID=510947 RepID=A0A562SCG4_9BACT|nr:GyrI-like domain-containing protein [Lacibacter cauensis]TWI78306.1 AraC family transcriptional regulator [Lacibacter cauensis]
MLQPRILELQPKTLAGKQQRMSFVHNQTGLLWQSFMQQRTQLAAVNDLLYSLQVYNADYFTTFNPANEFTKWALAEVIDTTALPEGFEHFHLPGGLYAVFDHKGSDTAIFQEIFSQWLPQSDYVVDDRPHFEVLGEKYKNNSEDSEEGIWIPVKKK